jgi:LacI family transcriptional regulator
MHAARPTIVDVARLARVGTSTVSRCIRGGPHVRPEVQQRVHSAIQQLGFEPNALARGLRRGRTNSIGVLFPQISISFFSRCIQHIELEASRQGISVILLAHQENLDQQSQKLALLRRSGVDGIILTTAPGTDIDLLRHELHGLPLVALDRPIGNPDRSPGDPDDHVDSITLDNRQSARLAANHLLHHHHHQRIACATLTPDVYTFRERVEGYQQVMDEAGLPTEVIQAPTQQDLRQQILATLRREPNLNALIALSDQSTFASVLAIRDLQRESSRTVAFVGFDDMDYAPLVQPAITMVRQPTQLFGHQAAHLLLRRIAADGPDELTQSNSLQLSAELILRESCGCNAS